MESGEQQGVLLSCTGCSGERQIYLTGLTLEDVVVFVTALGESPCAACGALERATKVFGFPELDDLEKALETIAEWFNRTEATPPGPEQRAPQGFNLSDQEVDIEPDPAD